MMKMFNAYNIRKTVPGKEGSMFRAGLRYAVIPALIAVMLCLAACDDIEVRPTLTRWTKNEAEKSEKKTVIMKNIAKGNWNFKITAEPGTNKIIFKKVGTNCTVGKVIKKTEECEAELEINKAIPYEITRGLLITEGEDQNGKKGTVEAKLESVA